jgi:heme/copper-type cytochrome/quinol oxidase subunit 2
VNLCPDFLGWKRNVLDRVLILVPLLLLVLVGLFFLLRPAPTPETATTPESEADGPQENTFDLAIVGGTMTPSEITDDEGDRVRFRRTSDSPLVFHLHGYDVEEEVEPGELTELAFDATLTGRFEIENEQTHEELSTLLVQPR